jgi:MoxR-like ATPase
MENISERIKLVIKGLCKGVYEKEEAIKLALLSALAGESMFLLGPPGVAKSLVARRLKFAFKDGTSFEYLMSKFSTPDEIFGPVSIKKLKDEDKYERLTEKYMPGANVVFLDEIWKAGASIQNALLTILNEKIYRNGEQEIKVNIKCIISASNELPKRGEGLEALWDRFLIRYLMDDIKQKSNFLNMILDKEDVYKDYVEPTYKISHEELEQWDRQINEIEVPIEVLNVIQVVKHKLEEFDNKHPEATFDVYDRRWKKIVRLLRTSAFLNGRAQVDLMDAFLLVHCLWSSPPQMEELKKMIAETIRKHGYTIALNLNNIKKEIETLEEDVRSETLITHHITVDDLYLIERQYYEVLNMVGVFDGKYIKQVEFDKLGIEEFVAINLYDENQKLTYKIRSRKSKKEHELEVMHNAQILAFQLKTVKTDKKVFIPKKPHEILQRYWNERVAQLVMYIQKAQQKLKEESPNELKNLRSNIFVNSDLAQIVEANMLDALNTVNSLSIRVEKIQHSYQNQE